MPDDHPEDKRKHEKPTEEWDTAKTEEARLTLRKSKLKPICMIIIKFFVSIRKFN